MFRPAEDHMQRMAGYHMQRGAVHDMGMILRMEEEQMLMRQMQEMEMMQMQAMGGMPPCGDGQWASPQQQQQSVGSLPGPTGPVSLPDTIPSSTVQPPAARAGNASTSPQWAVNPTIKGDANSQSPSTTAASRGLGLDGVPSPLGTSSTHAPKGLYSTTPSMNDANGPAAAHDTMYNVSSVYGGNPSAYAPAFTGGGLNENGSSAVGYSMYDANNASSMYQQPSPSSGATNASDAKAAPAAGAPAPGNASKAVTPALQRKSSATSLEKKSSTASMNPSDSASASTTHRSREIRQKNSELKRQNSSGIINGGSSSRPASAEKRSSSRHKNKCPSSPSSSKDKNTRQAFASSSARDKGKKHH
ncbi:protein of unknown function - conserved [Leishmania donovani]|uniref:Uncharacterized protein n=3 Tax=Leishmania donovani species complex TaxID=38574 RepID=A4I6Z0_LEIIN|nr:hypothetical protein, unknown function [Leishmania infantum JPCM5]CAC9520375.1 hypothetical_protein_-_conserved [Leishmania infantum]CAJ1991414.1 protein of unknown function - conserved [Leishmania donovani]CAM70567.1 hypothetical protein, unknown function [Leishmania infantum JPCM5]SUZ44444.1 hypothetical_protein_-_conserved [Leishmania infantum]VDZ47257.1 hypothetical_protein_conserved [Leishmania donovani]|eukprot:XP_001467509.1 hypothetical protein, unknown function [Leishmania infantum JPCM5]